MAVTVPNVQQLLDDHIFDTFQEVYGKDAPGDPWHEDHQNNNKNKYAIKREYRTVGPTDLMEFVKGAVTGHFGVVIVANTRLINTPIDIMGKKYGTRYETLIYAATMNYRQSQIGGSRLAYRMNRDLIEVLINNPPLINRLTIPFVIQATESEFTNTEMDVQRLLAIIPTSTLS